MDKYKYYIRGSQSKRREKAKKGGKKKLPHRKAEETQRTRGKVG